MIGPQIRQCNVYVYIHISSYYVYCMYILIHIYIYTHCMGLATTWGWSLILGYHPNFLLAAQLTFCWRAMEWRKSSWRSLPSLPFFTSNPNPSNHLLLSLFLVLPGRWIVVWQPSGRLYFLNPSGLTTKKDRFIVSLKKEWWSSCTLPVYRYTLRIYIYIYTYYIILRSK